MAQNQNQQSTGNKISTTYVTVIVLIVIVISISALFLAAEAYVTGQDPLVAGFLALIGLIAMTLSVFMLFQSRRQSVEMKLETPKVMTTIECKKCGYKNVREYQRGDYVFKELEPCQKCPDTKQIITAIYKEVKEKEKTYAV